MNYNNNSDQLTLAMIEASQGLIPQINNNNNNQSNLADYSAMSKNIILSNQENNEKKVFQNVFINSEQLKGVTLINILSQIQGLNLDLQNTTFYGFDFNQLNFVFVGKVDQENTTYLPESCCITQNIILKYKETNHSNIDQKVAKTTVKKISKDKNDLLMNKCQQSNNSNKRTRGRTVKEVQNMVSQWRDMCENGITEQNGTYQAIRNFDEAAKMMGIPKKTLDDYYYCIRKAKQLGFNFELNKNKKIGVLRQFIKKSDKNVQNSDEDSDEDITQFIQQNESNHNTKTPSADWSFDKPNFPQTESQTPLLGNYNQFEEDEKVFETSEGESLTPVDEGQSHYSIFDELC